MTALRIDMVTLEEKLYFEGELKGDMVVEIVAKTVNCIPTLQSRQTF